MQKKCKKMQNYLHISNIFCTFAADLGIVPAMTILKVRDMARKNALSALGEKERKQVLTLGRKRVVVYEIVAGKGMGLGIVQCSLYPNLGGVFPNLTTAMDRAQKIKSFHERQLDITFTAQREEE